MEKGDQGFNAEDFEWWYSEGEAPEDVWMRKETRDQADAEHLIDEATGEKDALASLGAPADMSISPAAPPQLRRPSSDPGKTASFSILDIPAEGATAPAPVQRPHLDRSGDARQRSPLAPILVAFVAGIVACAAIGGIWLHLESQQQEAAASQMSVERSLSRTRSVRVAIEVEGGTWDTARGDSSMLVQIKGRTLKGQQVDETQYVESDGMGIELRPGSYELTVAEPPTAIDGTQFRASITTVPVSFNSKAPDEVDSSANGGFDLHAVASAGVGQ